MAGAWITDSSHEPSDSRYKLGCRCDGCREAHAVYTKARRAASIAEDTLSHGTRACYDAGCRCRHCKGARRVAYFTVKTEYQPKRGRRIA